MDKVGEKYESLTEAEQAEDKYFANLSPDERVNLLLQLVTQYGHLFDGPSERFERVYRVVALGEG